MTITIPNNGKGDTPVTVYVNGVKYVVPRGQEVTVTDAVAAAVQNMDDELIRTNGYTEDARILPVVSAADNGKVLRVVNGQWAVSAETVELPAVSGSDNGKALIVSSGKWSAGNIPAELPDASSLEDGTTLAVDTHAWVTVAPVAAEI